MAVPTTTREETRREPERLQRRKRTPKWRDPRAIGLVVATLVLLGGAVAYATTSDTGTDSPTGTDTPAAPVTATNQDPTTRAGLTVERQAVYDPQSELVELTLTYSAQGAPLRGPFLEVIPETDGGDCPTVTWQEGDQSVDDRIDGLGTECGWSVDPGAPVPERGSVVLTATVPLAFEGADPSSELQAWLDGAQARTQDAINDDSVKGSTAYPVQRLQDIHVVPPFSTVSGRTLRITILPIWPSGEDRLNPLYDSRAIGEPTSALTAVAGGTEGIRFSDGCSGNLVVSGDGLLVTAGGFATDCTVITDVGNISDVESDPFDITTRGG